MESYQAAITEESYNSNRFNFFLLCIYFLFEFGRPQNLVPGLASLHLPLIIQIFLFIQLLRSGKLNLFMRPLMFYIGIIVLMAVHIPLAANNFWAFQMTKTVLVYFIPGLAMLFLIRDLVELESLIKFLTITFIILAVVGSLNKGKVPDSPFLGDENDFALAMNVGLAFSFFSMLKTKSGKMKIFYLVSSFLLIFASILSLSRGGFVGLIPVIVYLWLRTRHKLLSLLGFVVFLGILAVSAPQKYWHEIETISKGTEDETADLRIYYWKCGWSMFLANPVIGVGPGNFPWVIENYEPLGGHLGRYHGSRPAHSLYFTLIPELGIIGVFLFLALLWEHFKARRKIMRLYKEAMREVESPLQLDVLNTVRYIVYMIDGGLIAYFFTGIFLSVLYYPYFWILFMMMLALQHQFEKYLVYDFDEDLENQPQYA